MQRGGSINPTSFLQCLPPQTTGQCAGPISAQLFHLIDEVGILHTMSKNNKVCSRTQICSWNLCVNSWKYCWVLSKTKACDMVDLIFICSFKPLLFHVEDGQPGTALLSLLVSEASFFPTVTSPALPVLPNYEGNRRIMFFLLISVFPCYTSGASLRRLRGCLGELRLHSLACLCCLSIGFCNLFSK